MLHRLTPEQIEMAREGANKRQEFAERAGLKNYDGREFSPERDLENHLVGTVAEVAAAWLLRLKWDATVGRLDATDLEFLEVRGRRIGYFTDLAVRHGDEKKLRLPFFLVWVNLEQMTAEFIGWLCGWEAWERRGEPRHGVWYIPPPYHTVLSLQHWVECGHPMHWAPEKYRKGEVWGGGF